MNEFEKKMNALRRQFKAEQRHITKDAYRTIGHLNNAIGKVDSPEAREVLRAEKERVYETMRRTHEINRTCYLQQLELLSDQQSTHFESNPSARQMRRMMERISKVADDKELKSLEISFGNNRRATVYFGHKPYFA